MGFLFASKYFLTKNTFLNSKEIKSAICWDNQNMIYINIMSKEKWGGGHILAIWFFGDYLTIFKYFFRSVMGKTKYMPKKNLLAKKIQGSSYIAICSMFYFLN